MKRIAVISDTHNVLRPQVLDVLRECDAIIHAGDFTSEGILDMLRPLASVYVVRGNNDKTWAAGLSDTLRFEIDGIRFFITHDRRDVSRYLEGIDVVIFGHSHKYFQEIIDGRLWLNPGGCGRPRFSQELTMAVLTITDELAGNTAISAGDAAALAGNAAELSGDAAALSGNAASTAGTVAACGPLSRLRVKKILLER